MTGGMYLCAESTEKFGGGAFRVFTRRFGVGLLACFGVQIDRYVRLSFDGFTQLVDAVGGVTVDVERALVDHPRARSCGRPVLGGQVRVVQARRLAHGLLPAFHRRGIGGLIVQRAMQRAGVPKDEIALYLNEARSGDYDNLIQTTMRYLLPAILNTARPSRSATSVP